MEIRMSVEELAQKLDLEILEPGKGVICFRSAETNRPGLQFTGFYEHFPAQRVQIIGNADIHYLFSLSPEKLEKSMEQFMQHDIPCVVCARGHMPPDILLQCAKKYQVAIFRAVRKTDEVAHKLNNFLARQLSKQIMTHGVLMDIHGVGVLIRGESGIGKSETALELIRSGQRLVADDVVEVSRIGEKLLGRAPERTRYFMEVRGIGVVDVRYLYGVGAVLPEREIDLVIDLEYFQGQGQYIRTGTEAMRSMEILGIPVANTVLPVSPGRNIASIIEIAARNFRLKQLGYDPGTQFQASLQNLLDGKP